MTPGIASLNPGLLSSQPFRAAGLHAGGVKEISPRWLATLRSPGVGECPRNARRRRARKNWRFSNMRLEPMFGNRVRPSFVKELSALPPKPEHTVL